MDALYIALFGEAEKGEYEYPYLLTQVREIESTLGQPPPQTRGIPYAIQALLYQYHLIYFRVQEEGFSHRDYHAGLNFLLQERLVERLIAICAPGVSSGNIVKEILPVCDKYHSLFITNQSDLYDFLTDSM